MSAFVSIGCSTIDPTGYRLNALFRGVRARCPATSTRCRSVTVANVEMYLTLSRRILSLSARVGLT